MASRAKVPPTDLGSLYKYLLRDFAAPRKGECASCATLRKELKTILVTVVSCLKVGDYGVDEMREDHRAASTFEQGLPEGMDEATQAYYASAGKRDNVMRMENQEDDMADLSPALRSLMMQTKDGRA